MPTEVGTPEESVCPDVAIYCQSTRLKPQARARMVSRMSDGLQTCDIDIRVRYAEVDQMGVVHHSRFLEYFEMGRTELLRSSGVAYRDLEARGILLVIVKAEIRYAAPARYDDVLVLTTTLDRVGQVKIDHRYLLKRKSDGAVIARGATTLGCVDREGNIVPLPPEITG